MEIKQAVLEDHIVRKLGFNFIRVFLYDNTLH